MWPWSKKEKKSDSLPTVNDDTAIWKVAIEEGNAPLIVRFNESAQKWAGSSALPLKLGFAVPLNKQNPGGLPDPDENEQLGFVEDLIIAKIAAVTPGIQALSLTNGVMKEFVFYVPRETDIKPIHESISKKISSHQVQCMAVVEEDWQTYQGFTPR